MDYLILSELTLPRLLFRALARRPTCIVETLPQLPGTGNLLRRLADWLRAHGHVLDLRRDMAQAITYSTPNDLMRHEDVFAECEPWMEKFFDFQSSARRFGDYAIAYRHLCSNIAFRRYVIAYLLRDIVTSEGSRRYTFSGLDDFMVSFYRHRFGAPPPCPIARSPRMGFVLLRLLGGVIASFHTAMWIAWRIRISPPAPVSYFLGCDFAGSGQDAMLFNEIGDAPGDILCVLRNDRFRPAFDTFGLKADACLPTDGRFGPGEGARMMAGAVRQIARLHSRASNLPGECHYQLLLFPYRRAVYRSLFNRYRPRYFWSRDEYNTEHTIRSQELRRVGARSFGIMHGIYSIGEFSHTVRHMDFDIFYMLGRYAFDHAYKHTWPKHMSVRFIGSFGLTREEFERLPCPRPADIAVYLHPHPALEKCLAGVAEVARAFPEKKVFINSKGAFLEGPMKEPIARLLESGPENIEVYSDRSYDLFFKCRYVLSDGSTMTAEGIQFGLETFFLDFDVLLKTSLYRNFPRMCVRTADQAIDRIRAIEAGVSVYPRETLSELIEIDGPIAWDVIRRDLGLVEKTARPMPYFKIGTQPRAPTRKNGAGFAVDEQETSL